MWFVGWHLVHRVYPLLFCRMAVADLMSRVATLEDHLVSASNASRDTGEQVRQAEARALAAGTSALAAAQGGSAESGQSRPHSTTIGRQEDAGNLK